MKTPNSSPSIKKGFTLVEMLVSVSVLAIIMAMVGQIVNSAAQAISNSGKLLNCDEQARLIFGRMANDFSHMIKRSDVDVIFAKQAGVGSTAGANDAIYFVMQGAGSNGTAGYSPSSANLLTLAGYCIDSDAQGAQINPKLAAPLSDLNRLGHALTWDRSNTSVDNLVFVSFAAPTSGSSATALITGDGTTTGTTLDSHWGGTTIGSSSANYSPPKGGTNYGDYHALADQAFRFEYCFLLKDGTYSDVPIMTSVSGTYQNAGTAPPAPTNDSSQHYGAGSRWFDATDGRAFICTNPAVNNAVWAPLGAQDVSAIVVSIALMERDSRKVISSAATYNGLAALLADSSASTTPSNNTPLTTSPKLMQQVWQSRLDDASSSGFIAKSGLPASVAGRVQIYQRYFYLNANNL